MCKWEAFVEENFLDGMQYAGGACVLRTFKQHTIRRISYGKDQICKSKDLTTAAVH